MKLLHPVLPHLALSLVLAQMAACGSPGYNDNPSQQITTARLGCPATTDFVTVYFSVHVRPSAETPDARVNQDPYRAYCNDLPTGGQVFFTADLVGNEHRNVPFGIRVVEQASGGDGEAPRTLWEAPARTYPKGVIESQFQLDKKGRYAVYLTPGGAEADSLKIPLNVGVDSSLLPWAASVVNLLSIVATLALAGFGVFRYLRGRVPF